MPDYFWLQEALKHPDGPLPTIFGVVGVTCIVLLCVIGVATFWKRGE